MKSGYRIVWTEHALEELSRTVQYLETNFSEEEIGHLAKNIESTLRNISSNPNLYPQSSKQIGVHRAVVLTFNTLYYRLNINKNEIEILSFFSNRRDPKSLELE